ncbi:NAD(P)H-hydrate epimerase [Halorussus ruber]|uniref:NAD(P)H-hydrate epimerase n=1 Tax=Halorussus ruber TaxID=1126238 RepID=UPI001FE819DF|nr:NAD(P)H-hydrate epimerase [Halorussus ruber]
MSRDSFQTATGVTVPAVTADEMRDIDRVAVEEVGLGLLQMMENAGRTLAAHARELREYHRPDAPVAVLAGGGGNGGGGLCAARHLVNRGVPVAVSLDRDPESLSGAAATQFGTLREMEVETVAADAISTGEPDSVGEPAVIVDAVIGYSLRGPSRERAKNLFNVANDADAPVLSLDVPSGYDATTGEVPGETPDAAIAPDRTLTLALPKTGLDAVPGDRYLADIGIPKTVYERVGVEYDSPFEEPGLLDGYSVELTR